MNWDKYKAGVDYKVLSTHAGISTLRILNPEMIKEIDTSVVNQFKSHKTSGEFRKLERIIKRCTCITRDSFYNEDASCGYCIDQKTYEDLKA